MKTFIMALALSAFTVGALAPVLVASGASADDKKCKRGYTFSEDRGKCVRKKRRGSWWEARQDRSLITVD